MGKYKLKRVVVALLLLVTVAFSAGCGSSSSGNTSTTVAQNDWYGGFVRLSKVQSDIMAITDMLDSANYAVIMGNPDDYWNNENYHYLHFTPVYDDTMAITYYFNEQDDFSVIQSNFETALADYSNVTVEKIDVHHYTLSYNAYAKDWESWSDKWSTITLECIYDPTHMWMQMVSTCSINWEDTHNCFYEFAQIEPGIYAVQNEQERLYVVYDDDGNLKEFYHSVLPDVTQSTASAYLAAVEESENPEDVERIIYDPDYDSIYLDIDSVDADWVMEHGNFKSTVVYVDGVLSVSVTNLLTGDIESFSVKMVDESVADSNVESEENAEIEVVATTNAGSQSAFSSIILTVVIAIILLLALHVCTAIGYTYVFQSLDATHTMFAWVPILNMITLGFCAAGKEDKIHVAVVDLPATVVAFHPLISIALGVIPGIGMLLGTIFTVLCAGTVYINIYAKMEQTSKREQYVIGYLSGLICIIPAVKMLIYKVKAM